MLILPAGNQTMGITQNRKAHHDYFIEDHFEAGLVLTGWEVKSVRSGKAQIKEAYVTIKNNEVFLIGAHFTPLQSTSSHDYADPTRVKKVLLHRKEIARLIGKVERAGYTLVPLDLHFKRGFIKINIGLAKGKKQHDKRQSESKKDWEREKNRLMKNSRIRSD